MSRGVLLSFYDDQNNEQIAKKLMTVYEVTSIYLGMKKDNFGAKWKSSWYENFGTNYKNQDDKIDTFVKNYVLAATLDSDEFSVSSADGYEKKSAICQYGK